LTQITDGVIIYIFYYVILIRVHKKHGRRPPALVGGS